MKTLSEIFSEKDRTFSFELFPPKTEKGYRNLLGTIQNLADLRPDFISVTYGAGGGNRLKTLDIVKHIQGKHQIPGVAHLTCVCHTKDEILAILKEIKQRGIQNVLALRGDPPQDQPEWQPTEENFKYACELCGFIRKHFGDYFGIGVAGFPEGHPLAPSREKDQEYLKIKIDNGADYVITQLFFDNNDYFRYVQSLRALGVTKRIIPGILPITNYQNLVKFCAICRTRIPADVKSIFEPIQEDLEKTYIEGIKYAVKQCQGLLDGRAPGIHFYTLNKLQPVKEILTIIKGQNT